MSRPALMGPVAGLILLAAAGIAGAEPAVPSGCAAPDALAAIEPALSHAAAKIERADKQPGEKLKIVAIGSSSTSGSGASSPNLTYPARLEVELRERYPHLEITVVNRGKGGEDAAQELARFDRDVLVERPDLVIWQLGTNAVLRRDDVRSDGELIRRGVDRLAATGADVVLMDMQYAPRVLARPGHMVMERLIAEAAATTQVGLFRRFELMRYWHATPLAEAAPMIGPDGLHMTDRGYYCLAAELADALADNWRAHRDATRRAQTTAFSGTGSRTASTTAIAP